MTFWYSVPKHKKRQIIAVLGRAQCVRKTVTTSWYLTYLSVATQSKDKAKLDRETTPMQLERETVTVEPWL